MPFAMLSRVGPRKHVLDGGAQWRHLGNTTEPSMCGGDAAFLSNFFQRLFTHCCHFSDCKLLLIASDGLAG